MQFRFFTAKFLKEGGFKMLETIRTLGVVELVGVIAFAVTILTELLKEIGVIDRLPTKLLAIFLGLTTALFYASVTFTSFSLQAAVYTVSLGFAGAFVAIFGWDTLEEIWDRYSKEE